MKSLPKFFDCTMVPFTIPRASISFPGTWSILSSSIFFSSLYGRNIYANFNLTLVDDTHIYVGDNTMFGPNVVVATAGHPLLPSRPGHAPRSPVASGRGSPRPGCWQGHPW